MHTIKNNTKAKFGLAALVIAVVFFYGGVKYGQSYSSATVAGSAASRGAIGNGQFGQRRVGGAGGMGGFTSGEVLSKDDKSITLKLRSGGSMLIFVASSTPILKSTAGSADDIQIGAQVMVNGNTNSDGSMSAQSVQIRPATGQPTN